MPKPLDVGDGDKSLRDLSANLPGRPVIKTFTPEIKRRVDIPFLLIKMTGQDPDGRSVVFCPFHANTNTPAFHIRHEGKTFFCYGCQAKGDIIDFATIYYTQKKGVKPAFAMVVKFLGALVGITVDDSPSSLMYVANMLRAQDTQKFTGEMSDEMRRSLARWCEKFLKGPLSKLRDSDSDQCRTRWVLIWDYIDEMIEEIIGHTNAKTGAVYIEPRRVRPETFRREVNDLKNLIEEFCDEVLT